MKSEIIDITPTLHPGIGVWDGDTSFQVEKMLEMEKGAPWNLSTIHMSLHTGAHADAPWHCFPDREKIDEVALDSYIGRAIVFTRLGASPILAADLETVLAENPARLLVRTDPNRDFGRIRSEFAHFTESAARLLAESTLKLVGIDTPSVDDPSSNSLAVHRILIGSGISILENLSLSKVIDGTYELIALPLKIGGGDASPVRAILRSL